MSNAQTIEEPVEKKIETSRDLFCGADVSDFPLHKCIHDLFEEQAARSPEAIAVESETEQWTYEKLKGASNQVARYLRGIGIGPEKLVAICTERSPRMLACLLGILKAGGAYVPLDPTHPAERLKFILADSGAAVLLTEGNLSDNLKPISARVVNLDAQCKVIGQEDRASLRTEMSSENLAYVIYTSGSTGLPKGVELPHRCVVNFLFAMQRELQLNPKDIVLGLTTLSFDISVLELFLPLTIGARVHLTDSRNAADPEGLAKIISRSGATLVQTVPTVWRALVDSGWHGNKNLKIICGGEALPRKLANDLAERGETWNAYGPTETAVWSLLNKVKASNDPVTIGRPIANTTVYILEENRQPAPPNVAGELCIGGVGVARGYRNRPELTAEKFISNPRASANSQERIYRTGDVARYLPNGEIEFLGRADFQVKVRGHRIELGEIETALCAHPAISQAVVVAATDSKQQAILVAYVKPAAVTPLNQPLTLTLSPSDGEREKYLRSLNHSALDKSASREEVFSLSPSDGERAGVRGESPPRPDELRQFLKARLPDYMLPSIIMTLEEFPLTANGKIDRKSLPKPEPERRDLTKTFVTPRTPDEETLAGIWREVLGLERVGVHDNFFDLGGHSLSLAQVIARVRKTFQIELPLRNFFETPTIAALAELLRREQSRAAEYSPIQQSNSGIKSEELLAKLDQLSNDEIEALLNQVLAAQPMSSS